MHNDFERCYRALSSKDSRFDGVFVTGVTSTGIYCRPSCPAITPKRQNVRFFPTAAAAQEAGFRACKRCRPDATPGSPEWNVRADLVGRAMRLVGDGVVDREGVGGLAARLYVSERHLHRSLVAEVGAGPQALARARRSETARVLIETTSLPFTEVAFASGFASLRQFNDTVKQVFASTPTELRDKGSRSMNGTGVLTLRLPYRAPFAGRELLEFLGARAIEGLESFDGSVYRRSLRLPHGWGVAALSCADGHIRCELRLEQLRDLTAAVNRCRRLLDLDADPSAIARRLGHDEVLKGIGSFRRGLRVPGTVDGFELLTRAVLGQQVSVAAARTLASRLVALCGEELPSSDGDPRYVFPSPVAVATADLSTIGLPARRVQTLRRMARAVAEGQITVDEGADRVELERQLQAIPGIGPWTAAYVRMRLGDPDVFLVSDLGVIRRLEHAGIDVSPNSVEAMATRWRPWRSYAVMHLWTATSDRSSEQGGEDEKAAHRNVAKPVRGSKAGRDRRRSAKALSA